MGYIYIRGVRLLILEKSPGGTIIPGGTFIRESRATIDNVWPIDFGPYVHSTYVQNNPLMHSSYDQNAPLVYFVQPNYFEPRGHFAHSEGGRLTLLKFSMRGPMVATNFQSFSSKSNKNQDIFLKFSAFVHHMSVQIWLKNFGHISNSLPTTAHFGQNFGRL